MFTLKGFFGKIITDKTGMVRFLEDDIVLCRYSISGGIEGEYEALEITEAENGGAVVTYEYSRITSGEEYTERVKVPFEALSRIRAVCKKYGIFSWGEIKDSEVFLLDAPVTIVYVSTGDVSFSYNSNQEVPEYACGITTELYNVMKEYIKGVD